MSKKPAHLQILEKLRQIRQRAFACRSGRVAEQTSHQKSAIDVCSSTLACSQLAVSKVVKNDLEHYASSHPDSLAEKGTEERERELSERVSRDVMLNVVMEQQKVAIRQGLNRNRSRLTDFHMANSKPRTRGKKS